MEILPPAALAGQVVLELMVATAELEASVSHSLPVLMDQPQVAEVEVEVV